MRLGLVTGEFPPMKGGVGDYTVQLGRTLSGLGAEVHVIAPEACSGTRVPGLSVHPVVRRWSLGSLLRVRAMARRLDLRALLLQYQAGAFDLRGPIHLLPAWAGVPVFTNFHDLRAPWLFPLAGRLRRDAVTLLARASAGAIASDPEDVDELRRRGVARVVRIPIGSNIPCSPPAGWNRDALRERYGVGPTDPLLGHFGLLNSSKGCDDLVLALARLVRDGSRVRLVVVGGGVGGSDPSNRELATAIERLVSEHGLRDRVFATGHLPATEVSAHLLSCDLVVQPYRDGVSFRRGTLQAALGHGCAIVTTEPRRPDPAWRDGENLRLVPASDPRVLADAIEELLDDHPLRERIARGARASAADFAWESVAARMLDFMSGTFAAPREPASPASTDVGTGHGSPRGRVA